MSCREIHADTLTHIAGRVVTPSVFVQVEFPSATFRGWTGLGSILWNGQTWLGTGQVMQVSPAIETTDGSAQGYTITLSGLDSTTLSDFIDDEWFNSVVTVWLGFTEDRVVVSDPVQIFGGYLNDGTLDDNGKTATIKLECESRLIDQIKPRQWRYTDSDQQDLYAGDLGLQFVHRIQDQKISWGR